MAALASFRGSHERIHAARTTSTDLARYWEDFLEDGPSSASLEIGDGGICKLWVFCRYDAMPARFALKLGEILYHLRSALDSSIYAAAIESTGQDPPPNERQLEFPLCSTEKAFRDSARKIAPLSAECRNVVESVQPYNIPDVSSDLVVKNFNRSLDILHDWARKDRHRKLHVVGAWASNVAPLLELPEGCELVSAEVSPNTFLSGDTVIATYAIRGQATCGQLRANPNLTIDLAVNEPPPPRADNDSLGNRLEAMTMAVQVVVDTLEGLCA